jgi:hypothetical protein
VNTGRKRSSSGSRRGRPSGRRSGIYSTEQGSQCTLGGGDAQAGQGEAGQAEGDQIHTVQNRGHSVHWEEEELKRLKEKQVKRKDIRYILSRTGVSTSDSRRSRRSGKYSPGRVTKPFTFYLFWAFKPFLAVQVVQKGFFELSTIFPGVKKWRAWKSSFNAKLLFRAEQEKKLAQQKKEEEERLRKEEAEKKAKERPDWKLLGRTWRGGGPPSWILGDDVINSSKKWFLCILSAVLALGYDVISS